LPAKTVDLEPLFKRMKEDTEATTLSGIPWALDFDVNRVLTGRTPEIGEVRGSCRGDAERLEALHATGKLPDSGALQIDMETDNGERHVTFSSDQGGKVLEALGIFQRVQGGKLSFAGKMDDQDMARSGEGLLELNNFRVLEAPLLAKILSLGSLDGLASLLGREGIGFTRARIPLAWRDGALEMRDARAVGALGITADGTINQNSDALDIQGRSDSGVHAQLRARQGTVDRQLPRGRRRERRLRLQLQCARHDEGAESQRESDLGARPRRATADVHRSVPAALTAGARFQRAEPGPSGC
jgi:hypothetical protein